MQNQRYGSDLPLFKAIRPLDYPRFVGLVHNVVIVCLKEEGIVIRGCWGEVRARMKIRP